MQLHPLPNFEIQKYYQNEHNINDVYSRITKIKDGANVINLDELKSIGTHWIALYVNCNTESTFYYAIYFDSFGVELEFKNSLETKIS